MSPSVYITTRITKSGKRYVVRYRLGGRTFPLTHAGSFTTLKEARARRDFVAGEIAAGRNPADALRQIAAPPRARTVREWADAWIGSRIDAAPTTERVWRTHLARVLPTFGARDPDTIAASEIVEWVAAQARELSPASVSRYVSTLRQILDHAGLDPNPARDRTVKLPRLTTEEAQPPPASHVLRILDAMPRPHRLLYVLIEQTAMRVGEAATLAWGDVDVAGCQLRLRAAETKRHRARWVQVPEWLMTLLADTCPPEDITADRRVFPGLTAQTARRRMSRACTTAGVPHYHPHDLRHRRLSLWHGQGVPAKELSERAGHARASLTLDTYSHVMPIDEVSAEALSVLLVRSR